MNLSQPAMSLALKRLREYFDDDLVTYRSGQAELTPLGRMLLPKILQIIDISMEISATVDSFDPSTSVRQFTIAAPPAVLFFLLPRLQATLLSHAPGVELKAIAYSMTDEVRCDADIWIVPDWLIAPNMPSVIVSEERFSCLIDKKTGIQELDRDIYLGLSHLSFDQKNEVLYWSPKDQARELLAARRIVVNIDRLDAVPHIVTSLRVVATMTTRLAQYFVATNASVASVPAPQVLSPSRLVAHAAPGRARDAAIRWLLDQIRSHYMPMRA